MRVKQENTVLEIESNIIYNLEIKFLSIFIKKGLDE